MLQHVYTETYSQSSGELLQEHTTIHFVISWERSNFISCLCCKSGIHASPALLERMGLFPGIGRGTAFFPGVYHFSSTGPGEANVQSISGGRFFVFLCVFLSFTEGHVWGQNSMNNQQTAMQCAGFNFPCK